MAVLKDLIVHGPSRFINGAKFNTINAESIGASEGIFNKLVATTLDAREATIDNLTAENAKVVGMLDVEGELHTKSWTNANIANIGGSFYISPTVSTVIAANNTPMSITIGGSANARTFQVSGGAFATDAVKIYNGTTTSTASWVVGSHVMVTGNIRSSTTGVDYPLGTLTGYLTGALSASGFTVGEISSPALETILGELGTSNLKSYEIKISMFEIGPKASIKPVGVMMTSYGVDKSTYIDIYGGVNVKNSSGVTIPNVRIGYLGGLGALNTVNGETPTGWGIYTDNGYFSGVIVSNSGKIGNFTIANDLHSGTTGIGKDTNVYVSPGTNSSIAIANSPVNLNWAFTAGNKFGVTTAGDLYATGAKINGKIEATELTISSGGTTYSGVSAINANGYSIQIVEDKSAAYSSATMGDNNTYLYPILFLNGVKVETGIVYTNFIWFLDGATTGGTQGHSSNGGIVAEYGHTYRVTYSVDDTAVGEAQPSTYINVDPSKYITRIADNGITIHPETMAANSNYIHIDGNSLMVKRQVGTTAAVSTDAILASFGTTAQIGQNGSSRFLMNSDSLQAYDDDNSLYFEVTENGLTWGSGNTAATTTQVNTAAQTATNFIKTDGTGIKVQNSTDATNYVHIGSDGIQIYKNGNAIASFEDNITLGESTSIHNIITSTSFDFYKNQNTRIASIATEEETISGEGKYYLTKISTSGDDLQTNSGIKLQSSYGSYYSVLTLKNRKTSDANYADASLKTYATTSNGLHQSYLTMGYQSFVLNNWSIIGGHQLEAGLHGGHNINNSTSHLSLEIGSDQTAWTSIDMNTTSLGTVGNISFSCSHLYSDVALTVTSDKRLKQHKAFLAEDANKFIRQLKPARFIRNGEEHLGFYAQDVEEANEWNVELTPYIKDYKGLTYTEIIAPLVAYCQHLEKRINDLESQNRGGKE